MSHQAEATRRIREIIKIANEMFSINLDPEIRFNIQGMTAGRARLDEHALEFNHDLMVANWSKFDNTFIHEVAHLVDFELNRHNFMSARRSLHGPTWKAIMRHLGGDPRRCHTYDVSATKVRRVVKHKWVGTCGCVMNLGPQRHKRMLNGEVEYWVRGHSNCQYVYEGADQPRRTLTAAAQANRQSDSKQSRTKREDAAAIYRQTNGVRKEFIKTCQRELAMKTNTASTYHYNFKSGKWSS